LGFIRFKSVGLVLLSLLALLDSPIAFAGQDEFPSKNSDRPPTCKSIIDTKSQKQNQRRKVSAAPGQERRDPTHLFTPGIVGSGKLLDRNTPPHMRLVRITDRLGEYVLYYRLTEMVNSGGVKSYVWIPRRLPICPLTGAIDANYLIGRQFLLDEINAKGGSADALGTDLSNVGFINKNFPDKMITGDKYFYDFGMAVKNATDNKNSSFYRLDGDFFLNIIDQNSPYTVMDVQRALRVEVERNSETSKIATHFRKLRAIELRKKLLQRSEERTTEANPKKASEVLIENEKQHFLNDIGSGSPFLSFGAIQIGPEETTQSVLRRVDRLVHNNKVETKQKLNIDTTKYGSTGAPYDPLKKPNFEPLPLKNPEPPPGNYEKQLRLETPSEIDFSHLPVLTPTRVREMIRMGEISIAEYKFPLSSEKPFLVMEHYSKNEQGQNMIDALREVPINRVTGLIQGNHPENLPILEFFVNLSSQEQPKGFIWINALHLAPTNHHNEGSLAGDKYLLGTTKALQPQLRDTDGLFKLTGSEFLVTINHVPTQRDLDLITKRLMTALHDPSSPANEVFATQHRFEATQLDLLQEQLENLEIEIVSLGEKLTELLFRTARPQEIQQIKNKLRTAYHQRHDMLESEKAKIKRLQDPSHWHAQYQVESLWLTGGNINFKEALKATRGKHYQD